MRKFKRRGLVLYQGDCREVLKKIKDNKASSFCLDGPYNINYLGNKWDKHGAKGFYKFTKAWAKEAFRVLKPGGFLLSFCDSRTVHRMTTAFEDVGFRVHRSIYWMYGNGRPPNYDLKKAMQKYGYSEKLQEKFDGYGTDLKPATETVVVVQKPIAEKTVIENLKVWGVGAYNINECLVPYASEKDMKTNPAFRGKPVSTNASGSIGEPVMGRKEISQKSFYVPVKRDGRWPATVIHDGSEEIKAAFDIFGRRPSAKSPSKAKSKGGFIKGKRSQGNLPMDDGTAMRFFYCAKPSKKERTFGLEKLGYNPHPTVKPVKLIRYLLRLVTPPGGIVIDCFMGSGTTGMAAVVEGHRFIGIEQDLKFFRVSKKRIMKSVRTVKKVHER